MIGIVTPDRRDAERKGHIRPEGGEAELGYMFLLEVWGRGYATEACAAALDWFAGALPSEPAVLCPPVELVVDGAPDPRQDRANRS